MTSKQGHEKVDLNEMASKDSYVQFQGSEMVDLMGSEVCQSEDEECFKRRMVSEAHLDYIYTQNHKP
ncbi:conserved hypothetical protein [Ricinus communis]|uniref:Phytosulfokine n=2 Tax=Ricinus communis TaxID=3988 RepID=B9SN94_RICCO|nr:conserved hypothetical protein [Ricinus communis]